jgi:hypothetical protein
MLKKIMLYRYHAFFKWILLEYSVPVPWGVASHR